ncbi:MAG: molybdopterin molybdotransferase MoeA, partial [Candidatus Thermoplasmatota archaeon]|nr:molybdopterin molybdotransferase MoeA [Candidatus Thermoplasmatota archaeon]
ENISKNQLIFEKGTFISPREIGLLATMGISEISVIKQLKISIIPTGDELISPGKELLPGQIYESNSYVLEGLIKEMGHIPIRHDLVTDTIEDLRIELDKASNISDLIITSGGVSMGDFDLVRKIMEEEGEILFWRIKIKPGSPPLFGKWKNKPIFGLPGNPVSSHVVFQILINPWLKFITKANGPTPKIVKAKLLENIKLKKEFINFSRVIVENTGTEMIAYTTTHQGSGNLHSLTASNALTILPYNEKGTKNQIVDVLLL